MCDHSQLGRRSFLAAGGLAVTVTGLMPPTRPTRAAIPSAAPSIASTSAWNARPPAGPIDVRNTTPNKIIVHHTATENSTDTSQAHAFWLCRYIQDLHMDTNGWIDTGQNFTNSRGGHLMEGRHQSLQALSSGTQHVVGAHAGEQNPVSLGIENEGTYLSVDVPEALWNSLVELCAYMVSQYGIAPGEIYGHRDFMVTQCPGDVLYQRLPELRKAVGAASGQSVRQPVAWPLLHPGDSGPRVTALQLLLRERGIPVPVDGSYGQRTQEVAFRFAAERGHVRPSCTATRFPEPEGMFGGLAWRDLVPRLQPGMSGEAVRAAQVLLTWRGRHAAADERFGDQMSTSVRQFQADAGLRVNGVVDVDTWRHLLA